MWGVLHGEISGSINESGGVKEVWRVLRHVGGKKGRTAEHDNPIHTLPNINTLLISI